MSEVSNDYVINHGLPFNFNKSECIILGERYFFERPACYPKRGILKECDVLKYLGVNLTPYKTSRSG